MKKKPNTTTKSATKAKAIKAGVASDGQVIAAMPKKLKAKPVAAVAAKATAAKAPKATKPAKAKALSPTAVIRALLAGNPAIDSDGLEQALAKQGLHPPMSTINTVRADFLGCLKALQAAGRVKQH